MTKHGDRGRWKGKGIGGREERKVFESRMQKNAGGLQKGNGDVDPERRCQVASRDQSQDQDQNVIESPAKPAGQYVSVLVETRAE